MATPTRRRATKTSRTSSKRQPKQLVDFKFDGEAYVLDLKGDRVYRNWMAVEAQKGFTILGAYRSANASA
jgi:hypothetical protein